MKRTLLLFPFSAPLLALLGCRTEAAPELHSDPSPQSNAITTTTSTMAATAAPIDTAGGATARMTVATVPVSPDDPLHGHFTLDDATRGLPPGDKLTATIDTSHGKITCTLLADKAPITVANFVGLARGTRPWKTPQGTWASKPAYDGTTFHRIIKGFMIQGGDAAGTGAGEPGYVIPDELWPGAHHDHAGELCMANRGPNTNGAQFFITDASAPHLDRSYTIFGECEPEAAIHMIAGVATAAQDRPTSPVTIRKITITRTSAAGAVPFAGSPRDAATHD